MQMEGTQIAGSYGRHKGISDYCDCNLHSIPILTCVSDCPQSVSVPYTNMKRPHSQHNPSGCAVQVDPCVIIIRCVRVALPAVGNCQNIEGALLMMMSWLKIT